MAFPSLAGIEAAYNFLAAGQAKPLLAHLNDLVQGTHQILLAMCARHRPPPELLRVNPGTPRSPVIPLLTSQPRNLAKHCQQKGFMVRPIVVPTVPKGQERIRICLHAKNSMAEVRGLIEAVEEWLLEAMEGQGGCGEMAAMDISHGQLPLQKRVTRKAKM